MNAPVIVPQHPCQKCGTPSIFECPDCGGCHEGLRCCTCNATGSASTPPRSNGKIAPTKKKPWAAPRISHLEPESELVRRSGLKLPDTALATALDDIEAILRSYIWRPSDWEYHALALWILHTHLIDAFDWSPLLGIPSPDGGYGKTQTCLLCTALCRNGRYYEKLTVATAKRLLDSGNSQGGVTALFDQVRGGNYEWEDLFDIGTRRGAKMRSSVKPTNGKDWEPEAYDVFGPKAVGYLSGHDALNGTNISRAIIINYLEKGGHRVKHRYPYDADCLEKAPAEVRELNGRLAALATPEMIQRVRDAVHQTNLPPGRRNDTYRPLVAIGDVAGEPWRQRARALLTADVGQYRKLSRNLQLLVDMGGVCEGMADDDFLPSADAITRLRLIEESPWEDVRLSGRGLSDIMRAWGIYPGHNRERTRRGYSIHAIRQALGNQREGGAS